MSVPCRWYCNWSSVGCPQCQSPVLCHQSHPCSTECELIFASEARPQSVYIASLISYTLAMIWGVCMCKKICFKYSLHSLAMHFSLTAVVPTAIHWWRSHSSVHWWVAGSPLILVAMLAVLQYGILSLSSSPDSVWNIYQRSVCHHYHCSIQRPGQAKRQPNTLLLIWWHFSLQGTHKSIKNNQNAKATVTAIIDGTGSIGAALGPLLVGWLSGTRLVSVS